jgi:hypothetical protein
MSKNDFDLFAIIGKDEIPISLSDAKKIQSDLMKIAHSLKADGVKYITSVEYELAAEEVGRRFGVTSDDIKRVTGYLAAKSRQPESKSEESKSKESETKTKTKTKTEMLIEELQEKHRKEIKELKEKIDQIEQEERANLKIIKGKFRGDFAKVTTGGKGYKWRVYGTGIDHTHYHICYMEDIEKANRLAMQIEKLVEAKVLEAIAQETN